MPDDGLDTDLARRLHRAGVELALLQECLQACRQSRQGDETLTLGVLLLARGVEPALIDRALADDPMADAVAPSSTGDYRVLHELARGGMGVVYEAVHTQTGARVALKQILGGLELEGEDRARFRREAEVVAALRHPGIVAIHAADLDVAQPYMVQELLTGGTLKSKVDKQGSLSVDEARAITRRLCEALEYAHSCGVIHRDLKPQNVLFDERGDPHLADFGLASGRGFGRLTQTGAILGTPAYMAPEQATDAKRVDARADVYGVGALLYFMLTGRAPFGRGLGLYQTLNQVLNTEPLSPRELRPDVPPDLEGVCLQALAKSPDARFASVAELAAALEEEQTPSGTPLRGGLPVALVVLLILGVGLLVWWTRPGDPATRTTSSAAPASPVPLLPASVEDGLAALAARRAVDLDRLEVLLLARLEAGEPVAGLGWSEVPPEPGDRLLELVSLFELPLGGKTTLLRELELERRSLHPDGSWWMDLSGDQRQALEATVGLIESALDRAKQSPGATRVFLGRALDTLARRVLTRTSQEAVSSDGRWFERVRPSLSGVPAAVATRVWIARLYDLSAGPGMRPEARAFLELGTPTSEPGDRLFVVTRGFAVARLGHLAEHRDLQRRWFERALEEEPELEASQRILSPTLGTGLMARCLDRYHELIYAKLEAGEDCPGLFERARDLGLSLEAKRDRRAATRRQRALTSLLGAEPVDVARALLGENRDGVSEAWLVAQTYLIEGQPKQAEKLLVDLLQRDLSARGYIAIVECLRHARTLTGGRLPDWPSEPIYFATPWPVTQDDARNTEDHWWPGRD